MPKAATGREEYLKSIYKHTLRTSKVQSDQMSCAAVPAVCSLTLGRRCNITVTMAQGHHLPRSLNFGNEVNKKILHQRSANAFEIESQVNPATATLGQVVSFGVLGLPGFSSQLLQTD
jgi:hypothetical protein